MMDFSYERVVKDAAVCAEGRLPAHSDHVPYRTAEEMHAGVFLLLKDSSESFEIDGPVLERGHQRGA